MRLHVKVKENSITLVLMGELSLAKFGIGSAITNCLDKLKKNASGCSFQA